MLSEKSVQEHMAKRNEAIREQMRAGAASVAPPQALALDPGSVPNGFGAVSDHDRKEEQSRHDEGLRLKCLELARTFGVTAADVVTHARAFYEFTQGSPPGGSTIMPLPKEWTDGSRDTAA